MGIAIGIPDLTITKLPEITKPVQTIYGKQSHLAFKAGRHTDFRVVNPEDPDMALSWAVRHWPAPGEQRLAVQQPDHTAEYVGWEGIIGSGYGEGKVELKEYGIADILSSGKDKMTIATSPPGSKEEIYTLVRMKGDNWLIMNRTGKTGGKPGYRKLADMTTRDDFEITREYITGYRDAVSEALR